MPRSRRLQKSAIAGCLAMWVIVLAACGSAGRSDTETVILVSAASSLQGSLDDIAKQFEMKHPTIRIQFNYGSSGTLQRQIEQGAPVDLFLSAGKPQVDALIARKLVQESDTVLTNQLVLIVPTGSAGRLNDPAHLQDTLIAHIAMGQPDSVPAGSYARQALQHDGLWDKVQDKLVFAQNVRQVLAYVETGNADAGFVYRSDAMSSSKVDIAFALPEDSHDAIVYPFALLFGAPHSKEAAEFLRYLHGSDATDVFTRFGFQKR